MRKRKTIKDDLAVVTALSRLARGEHLDALKKRKTPVRTNPKNEMVEKELEKNIILALLQAGYVVYKTGSAGVHDYNCCWNPKGCSDLFVLGKPHGIVCLEVKQPASRNKKNGGLTGKQPEFQSLMSQLGIKYRVVYSVTEALGFVGNNI